MAIAPQEGQQLWSDSQMLSISEEDPTMMKQIRDTHAPDGREVELKLKVLLQIIGAIFHRAVPGIAGIVRGTQAHFDALDDNALPSGFDDMPELLSYINKISFEFSGGGDAHATTVTILNILSSYSWDAKLVVALAVFAVNYGEFGLVAQQYSTNALAEAVSLLMRLPEIIKCADTLKPKFDTISNLIETMLVATKGVVEFKELPALYKLAMDTIIAAVYWTIRSMVACSSQILGLISMDHEYVPSTKETLELSSLAHKLKSIISNLAEKKSIISSDNAMMKQIQATHAPDGREVELKPLLNIIEDIFQRAASGVLCIDAQGTQAHLDALDDKALHSGFDERPELLSYTINKVSCEISCKCSGGGDARATTGVIFNILTSYSWESKVVITLAAFAVNYGEFWLVAQCYSTNSLARVVALLKQLPEIFERAAILKPTFDALSNLIKAMLAVTKCILEFRELPSQYISPDTPELKTATAHIPAAVYWTIRSIVACASQIRGFIGMSHEHIASTTEPWELSSMAHKVNNIHTHLKNQLIRCYLYIDEKKLVEAFMTLQRLFETPHIDNIKIVRALIYAKDDLLPLVDGATKQRVSIDVLRRKIVLLFISDLELSHDELFILIETYQETRQHPTRAESQFEVVWLPVVDKTIPWNAAMQMQFEELQAMMPWYSIFHPSLIDPAVIRCIKKIWAFHKKPLVVVLDPQGKVANQNATHMICIWGSLAFPFTYSKEEALWNAESWRIELLVDSIDPLILTWIAEGKHICLFGGEDIEWVKKFISTARAVAQEAQIQLEMLYVGKSNPREKVRRIANTIVTEKLGHAWQEPTLLWFFWVRLESMWHSKVQQSKSVENDPIMQEIKTMLSFDGSDQGWAVIGKGSSTRMAKAKGETILKSLTEFDTWKPRLAEISFIDALNEYLHLHELLSSAPEF